VVDARPPERTNTPDTTIDPIDGALKIEWEMPNGNGIEVTSYELEIKNTNGNWEKTTECEISEINPSDSTIYQSTYNDAGDHLFCNVNM